MHYISFQNLVKMLKKRNSKILMKIIVKLIANCLQTRVNLLYTINSVSFGTITNDSNNIECV